MQIQFFYVLRSNKIEMLCNIIVTIALGAATPVAVPCEVDKQEEG